MCPECGKYAGPAVFLASIFIVGGAGMIAQSLANGPVVGWLRWESLLIGGIFVTAGTGRLLLIRRHRRRIIRDQKGLCRSCGYNLTGNMSGVCPECGTRA
jgi:predicted RNA-binding Zn-ribbon protein involved in translation (DUF1610 family)